MALAAEEGDRAIERLRVPPHSIEAERAVLGGLMLDNATWEQIGDRLRGEDFYRRDHQLIFAALEDHAARALPFDVVTVGDWLESRGELAEAGGLAYLIGLANETPSAANVRAYGDIVAERAMLRALISAGGEIAGSAFATEGRPLIEIIDAAEQRVFEIADRGSRGRQGFRRISTLLADAVDRLHELEKSKSGITGLATGIGDFDNYTAGLQPGDLVIVAGRPSMGKCLAHDSEVVLGDGSVSTIERLYTRKQAELLTLRPDWRLAKTAPSAYVDDGVRPVYRVTTRLGRRIETTLSHPYLTVEGWRPLAKLKVGAKVAVPRVLPVFGSEEVPDHQAALLGYFLGDGTLGGTTPAFTNSNPRMQADFAQAVAAFGGLRVTRRDSAGTRTPAFFVVLDRSGWPDGRHRLAILLKETFAERALNGRAVARALGIQPSTVSQWVNGISAPSSELGARLVAWLAVEEDSPLARTLRMVTAGNQMRTWLESLDVWGCGAAEKFVPAAVFRWRREQLAVFLNRLFATDGWATVLTAGQSQLGYCTVSERLARQLQHLLLRFGVIAGLKHRNVRYQNGTREAWQLDITDARSIRRFIETIGIFGKEAALAKVTQALSARRYQTNRDLIPREVWKLVEEAKGAESWAGLARRAGLKGASNIHAHKRSLSRDRLGALARALDNVELAAIAASDVYWDEIVAIEYAGEKQVYDLTIPATHNFVANDVCVHNTALAMNIAENVAIGEKLPTAIFSMEMPAVQLTLRMVSSLGRIDQGRLRTGQLAVEEWPRVTSVIGMMSSAPLFVDDSAALSPTELRARARRLKRENKDLALIVIDYLQLMQVPGTRENRATEISEISRNLKALAKELSVPIVALSQLNRGVEQRPNKRPIMSDLRESGCLTGETLIALANTGERVPIAQLAASQRPIKVWALDEATYRLKMAKVTRAFFTGTKPVYKLKTQLGRTVRATGNHKFLTIHGWIRLDQLAVGSRIALPRTVPAIRRASMSDAELGLLAHLIGDGCTLPRHVVQYTTREADLAKLVARLAVESFGSSVTPRVHRERNWYQVYLSSTRRLTHGVRNPVANWLDELEIWGLRSHEKSVPAEVFKQPATQIACFLRHLWATDGCARMRSGKSPGSNIYYASSSKRLASDVQALLLRLGIKARLTRIAQAGKGRDQYHVIVSGREDVLRFVEDVGAVGCYRRTAMADIRQHSEALVANTNRDIIPADVWNLFVRPAMTLAGLTHRALHEKLAMSYSGMTIFKQNVSRLRAARVAVAVASEQLKCLSESDVYWDSIKSIEQDGVEAVYDLTVPDGHNFVANDIIVHNSLEQDADLVVMLYRDEYYNPSSPEKGLAEIIITKQRNGPTGTVKATFLERYTRFENYIPDSSVPESFG